MDGLYSLNSVLFTNTYYLIELVKVLIVNAANVNAKIRDRPSGNTAVHVLCQHYKNDLLVVDIVGLLVENGGSINERNYFGRKPFGYLGKRGVEKCENFY